jgi:hypothetical protein
MQKRLFATSIVVGVCLAVVLGLRPVSAQFQQVRAQPNADPRLISTRVTMDSFGHAYFIRDTKTNGCWLELTDGDAPVLAVAPPEACQVAGATDPR